MLRSARKYSLPRHGRFRANSPLIGLLVGFVLLGVAALASWSDRVHAPVRSPPPLVTADLSATVPARVLKVVDGDTFDARVELKPGFR
jgi:hypothetical protein